LGSFSRFFHLVRIEYVMVIVGIVIIVLMSVATIPQVENHHDFRSLEHSFWFSVMTLVAGEPIGGMPQSFVGRATTLALMLTGLSVFAIMAGTVSAVMIDSLSNLKLRTMEIEDLDGHVVVCGWNAAGELLINELLLERAERGIVVIADRDDLDQIELFRRSRDHLFFLRGDYTLIDVLKRAGVDRAKSSVLLADDSGDDRSPQDRDARTVLAAMLIEKLNASIFTTVQLLNRDNEASLRKVGVEEIVVSEEMVGGILASVVKSPGIVSVLDELLTASYGHQFFKSAVPADLVGKTVADAMQVLKERYNATLLAVDSIGENEEMIVNPPSDLILHDAHRIVVAADQPLDSMR
jgi:voltage-gated potassium channel